MPPQPFDLASDCQQPEGYTTLEQLGEIPCVKYLTILIKNLISGISFLCLLAVLFLVLILGVIRSIRGGQGEEFSYQGVDRLPVCLIKTFPVTSYLIRFHPNYIRVTYWSSFY